MAIIKSRIKVELEQRKMGNAGTFKCVLFKSVLAKLRDFTNSNILT